MPMPSILKGILIVVFVLIMLVGAFLAPERGKVVWTRRDWIGGGVLFIGIAGFAGSVLLSALIP
ncbi:MAG: hypothetical protein A2Z96_03610 [Spirochaetes bacterium GWB1_48_6]|nr:MAG: hypothetical protein A2Z96_03610 [Spirochaetes bacterium GWB1_48_6]